jgi:hypothetical protein
MDPDATLRWIDDSIDYGNTEDAEFYCRELHDWIKSRGFEPRWDDYPSARDFYRDVIAGAE